MATGMQQLYRHVVGSPELCAELAACFQSEHFVKRALAIARSANIALSEDEVKASIRPDPLGISRWGEAPVVLNGFAPPGWLPIQSLTGPNSLEFDWGFFGDRVIHRPFYQEEVLATGSLPFNLAFRTRTALVDMMNDMSQEPVAPDGLIFHMSRCGSTLCAQSLVAAGHLVFSEPEPLEPVVQWAAGGDASADQHILALRAIVTAFGRRRQPGQRFYLKLDCWHILALPLFRAAFPDTPWVFLYRDPVEVMVSQSRVPSIQVVPGLLPPALFGVEDPFQMPMSEYCAIVLGKMCSAAAEHLESENGLALNYAELPEDLTEILPDHFGFTVDTQTLRAMEEARLRHAKFPNQAFVKDSETKQAEASDEVRRFAAVHAYPAYENLEKIHLRHR